MTSKLFKYVISKYIQQQKVFLICLLTSCLLAILLLYLPTVLQSLISKNFSYEDTRTSLIACGYLVFMGGIANINFYFSSKLSSEIGASIQVEFMEKWLKTLPIDREKRLPKPNAIFLNDISILSVAIGNSIIPIIFNLALLLFSLLFLSFISILLTVVIIIAICGLALLNFLLEKKIERLTRVVQEKTNQATEKTLELINKVDLIQSFNVMGSEIRNMTDWQKDSLFALYKKNRFQAVFGGGLMIASLLLLVLLISLSSYLVTIGHISTGSLVGFVSYILLAGRAFNQVSANYSSIRRAKCSFDKINQFISQAFNVEKSHENTLEPNIKLNNVSFLYPNSDFRIKDLSVEFNKNKIYSIVGQSGSGKSSLLNLIRGWYAPDEGSIVFNSTCTGYFELSHFINYLGSEAILLNRSIERNISLSGNYDQGLIELTLSKLGLNNIDIFDEKLTSTLSTGQKQKVAFARAILSKKPVLILDEATAVLDSQSEQDLYKLVKDNQFIKLVIIVSHRLSSIRHADKIMVMDKGEVIESGGHEELVKREKGYYKIFEEQMDDAIEA
ncbi:MULTISPECIES: ABC transporter ATP-binding protein [unclassified Pseudoalteromonas]|jgi:ABC-type multidrug transport system fused ATPase/permease subunit|uniref:ATP-binding cassette domain-containing protein n=1 Tax=unclassified Pseudoalteromonas TaxID=194690 RepID=UPI000560CB91|nr:MULTISPECIES: ABC transporter ATP-binding protein [unclassified Pseudoalteromonas]MDN3405445.1 ABC transporter ATP-binding protein [Pseudoalteromonas sp. APC 3218]MDN3410900.1 ABC transporter ATP-binding protein [Pseudoalteromonas sp. APC 3894]MDN3418213.1 ABC transporter ATP-binding protein [Pseudoalteromonas sp. APC 3227]MDN3421911.1 ABC transporter ATP-binding protein [Pseudoalteromonas sp. APC 3895]MDN3425607.1 ABC transporter ATP-binding protein [Pseudoalteromonas sp. APC 3896]